MKLVCTFTSNSIRVLRQSPVIALAAIAIMTVSNSRAETPPPLPSAPGTNDASLNKADRPQAEDFSTTPYTQYGEFNEAEDEAQDELFFQYGRFFGVSLGGGYHGVLGNRGVLWQGGFPMVAMRIHFWFDFNLSLQMGFFTVTHSYAHPTDGTINVYVSSLGIDLKYYFNTKDLSAAVTFANPFIVFGGGGYKKSESSAKGLGSDDDNTFGLNIGAGLEFPITHKKTYFFIETKAHFPNYEDKYSAAFEKSHGINDLTGMFYSITGNILFTW